MYLKIEYIKLNHLAKNLRQRRSRSPVFFLTHARKGSFTVEAAVTFPLVVMILASLMQLFTAAAFQSKLHDELENVGRELSYYYFAVDELKTEEERSLARSVAENAVFLAVSETVVRGLVNDRMGDVPYADLLVKNGMNGLSYVLSRYDEETKTIVLRADYRVLIPFLPFSETTIPESCVTVHRVWTGREMEPYEEEQIVYVAENGTVYHTALSCTHLSLSIREVARSKIDKIRNSSGGKYYPCERCGGGSGNVYVTTYGDRYHGDKTCAGLKRSIESIPISQVGDKTLCKRCASRSRS